MRENENNTGFKNIFIKGAIVYNPVLVQLVGLCPVVAASSNLTRAAALSAAIFVSLTVSCVVASALLKKIPRWIRIALYLLIGLLIICPALLFVETKTLANLSLGIKIYLPLAAVSSVTAVHCEQFAVKNDARTAFYDAAAVGAGTSAVLLLTGAVRETLGNSSIAGIPIGLPATLKGMAFPFGSLIILGFAAAVLRTAVKRFYPEYYSPTGETDAKRPPVPEPALSGTEIREVEIFDDAPDVYGKSPEAVPASPEEEIEEILKSLENYLERGDGKK